MKRGLGMAAMVLGILGVVVSILATFWAVRLIGGASDAVTSVTGGLDRTLAATADRITDVRSGSETRGDGLRGLIDGAQGSLVALEANPLVGLLPIDIAGISDALDEAATGAGQQLDGVAIDSIEDSIVGAQLRLAEVQQSLRTWLRLAAILLVLVGIWSTWAQYHLAGWGYRSWRSNPPVAS